MKVAIAVDGSEHADFAFHWYLDHHHKPDNHVILVHTTELPLNPAFVSRGGLALPHHEWVAIVRRADNVYRALEEKISAILKQRDVSYQFVRVEGHPGHSICEVVKKKDVGMIVVGTRGLGKVRRTFLGSVSDYILHHAHVPVVICRR